MIGAIAGASSAQAINPAQTQFSGVVNYLGSPSQAGSIAVFWSTTMSAWGRRYTKPVLQYYNGAGVGDRNTPCGSTTVWRNNSFYCSGSNTIYLDYTWNQRMTNQYGDFGSGGILAHEWGHAAQAWLGYGYVGYKSEYHADCLAGMYSRYGYSTGRLVGSDYSEMYNWLYAQPYSADHGTGSIRAAWYQYGYTQYSMAACDQVFAKTANSTVDAKAAASTVGASAGSQVLRTAPTGTDRRPVTPSIVGLTGVVRTPTLTPTGAALTGVASPDGNRIP